MLENITIPLTVDTKPYTVYLAGTPAPHVALGVSPHKHALCEVHVVVKGSLCFDLNGKKYEVAACQAILIPANRHHSSSVIKSPAREFSFYLDGDITNCTIALYSNEVFKGILRCVQDCQIRNDVTPMIPCFVRFVLDLALKGRANSVAPVKPIYYIREYINANYRQNISLQELAQHLKLTTKQVHRIMVAETGHSLTQEILFTRMQAAEFLIQNTNQSLAEIARSVGYQTYTGFWKARKQYVKIKKS